MELTRFITEDGVEVIVETGDDEPAIIPVARGADGIADAAATLDSGLDRITAVAGSAVRRLRAMAQRPDEITVELGVRLNASVGAVIARSESEGHLAVTLVWRTGHADTPDS
ncbi:CU044_2847 family protein [Streptomyces sp. FR-108]|uniref:CU044_2847 family protein n=1 Tax=Streptomyces sp. FR-108 TaxID=3416665 RepID=UPI003CEC6DF0